ncbi:MAG: septum formation protein Maf [Candidatus Omnitrophica bacterium]|jgi:MAF protein|nr:septum formation protein Maf [Candidatus Omnitrophota bacterium]MDD5505393.1 Maf and M48 domain-containing protein [Candidatus Omnitrophota bacterium]
MKTIYLASNSKARKKLLKSLGLRFKVLPSKVKEGRSVKGISYAQLVKLNAFRKAEDVAAKVREGIIIAADTVMVQDGRIFGKPKDLQRARQMLKIMSNKPQAVYTGIAVIRKEKGRSRILTGCEKTTVFMDKLSDKEISGYFKKVSPLDKAGSFDIQGRGALFIRRINGCFYNVVGLPLRKLYLIFKKLNLKFFLFFLPALFLAGCSTEYNVVTGEQESYYYSTDKEVQMGRAIAREVAKEYKLGNDPLMQKRVEDIGKKIIAVCDRKEIDYYFFVLEDDSVNAVSLPGGYVYVFKGLVDKVSNDDELAGVIAHEVGHIVARHSIKKLQAQQGYSILRLLVAVAPSSGGVGAAADTAFTELILGYSREDELLADQLGTRYAKLAGYDPHAMVKFLEKLQDVEKRRPLQEKNYYKTHPYVPDRIRTVKEEMGDRIDFDDYINIEQQPHK